MYIALHHPGIFSQIQSGEVKQTTRIPLLNDEPIKSIGGSEQLILHSGDTIETCLGDAVIESIILYRGNSKLAYLQETTREKWATNEGFPNYRGAEEFFSKKYGAGWDTRDMMAIHFKGKWGQDD